MACGGGHGRPCRARPARHDNAGIDSLHHAVTGGVRSAIRVCCRSGGGACRPRYTMSASPLRWKSAPCAPSCSIHFHQDFGWEIRCGHGGPKKWCLILLVFFTKRTAHRRKRLICLYSSLNYFERYMDRSAVSAVCRCFHWDQNLLPCQSFGRRCHPSSSRIAAIRRWSAVPIFDLSKNRAC
jgi:hypothetical protein